MVKDSLKNEYKFVIDILTDAIFKKTEHVIQVGQHEMSLSRVFAKIERV